MATVKDLGEDALRDLGILAAGETMTAEDGALVFSRLNDLIDQWATEELLIHEITRTTWALVSGTRDYTVGSGGDVNIAWPTYISAVAYNDTSVSPEQEYALGPLLTDDGWEAVLEKDLTDDRPSKAYYNPTHPLGTLSFWPAPTSSSLEGVIYVPTAVVQFAALSTTVTLPPGYKRMMVKNLALEIAPSFGRVPNPELVKAAQHSMSTVKRKNWRPADLAFDVLAGGGSGYDIRTDE